MLPRHVHRMLKMDHYLLPPPKILLTKLVLALFRFLKGMSEFLGLSLPVPCCPLPSVWLKALCSSLCTHVCVLKWGSSLSCQNRRSGWHFSLYKGSSSRMTGATSEPAEKTLFIFSIAFKIVSTFSHRFMSIWFIVCMFSTLKLYITPSWKFETCSKINSLTL
jgi:hypothetical protein